MTNLYNNLDEDQPVLEGFRSLKPSKIPPIFQIGGGDSSPGTGPEVFSPNFYKRIVAYWNVETQAYEQYIPHIPPTDFDVKIGYPYYVNQSSL